MSEKRLSYRAREIEAWIEAHMVDTNGIVYTFVDRTTGKPLTNDVVESVDHIKLPRGSTAGWWAYENCTMVTAAYMQGLLFRFEREGDLQALARARRCFQALLHIYEMGKEVEEGFMPKIYDNLLTAETSSDQVLFGMCALDHFHPHATPAEQKQISRMIANMTRFFLKRGYKYTYFGVKDMQWPLPRFTFNNLMAWKHSGEEIFKKEYERLLEMGVNECPGEEQVRPKLAGQFKKTRLEEEEGGWLISYPSNCAQMDLTELEYLLRMDPSNPWAMKWRRSAVQMWSEGSLAITEDGRAYSFLIMDFDTHELRAMKSRFLPKEKDRPQADNVSAPDTDDWRFFPFMTYVHTAKGSVSTLFARSGIAIAPFVPRELRIVPLARRIIKSFDLYDFSYFDDPELFAPQFKFYTNVMSGDSITHWLWGYWQGRMNGVFAESE
jgi:hypothetical protein